MKFGAIIAMWLLGCGNPRTGIESVPKEFRGEYRVFLEGCIPDQEEKGFSPYYAARYCHDGAVEKFSRLVARDD